MTFLTFLRILSTVLAIIHFAATLTIISQEKVAIACFAPAIIMARLTGPSQIVTSLTFLSIAQVICGIPFLCNVTLALVGRKVHE